MNWLARLWRGSPADAVAASTQDAASCLRAGFDCECLGDFAGAEHDYRRALEIDGAHADALYFLSRLAERDRRDEEAIALLQRVVELRPLEAVYQLALGNALMNAKRHAEALEVNRTALGLQPECTAMRNNYAAALIELDRREEARLELEQLRETLPNAAEVHFNLAGIYREYGQTDEAIAAYRRAVELTPRHAPTWSNLLLETNYSASLDAAAIAAEHRRFGEEFARRYAAPAADSAWPRRLRVAYISPDFRDHVVMRFFEPALANHDRAKFETYCYSTYPRKDKVSDRLRALASRWVDCEDLSEAELADRIRADRIDILVDLAGHTAGNSLLVLAMKPAPVQASYLGYPNTTGLGAVDFRITDALADPPGDADRFSAERLVRLPRSYFCYRPERDSPEVARLPAVAAGGVTFGCFNNFTKLSGPFLDTAARVLSQVPRSRLLLKGRPLGIARIADAVRGRFARNGIDAARLSLRGWEKSVRSHLSIYDEVDIALDSFPYNGATTTCEAMWMGVPVVTLAGDRHAGRAGASLLGAVGLADCVAHTAERYVQICKSLSGDLARLAALRGGLRERMRRSPLMDESGFVQELERCYEGLWQARNRSGELAGTSAGESLADLLAHARRLHAAGRSTEAFAACERILAQSPAHAQAITLLWDLAFESGTPGAAIDPLNRAIDAASGVASLHYMLGCVLQSQQKVWDSIASFRQSLALDPANAKAHNNLGCVLEAIGDLNAAADCYREAARLDPAMAQAHYNLGNLFKQMGEARQAIAHIRQALSLEPRHADWRSNLGSLNYDLLQLDEAVADFKAALEIDPGDGRAHVGLGGALLLAGNVEAATAAFAAAHEREPARQDIGSWSLLAQHYREDQEPADLFRAHLAWAERHARGLARWSAHELKPRHKRRLNIGYLSPDFLRHPVASFIEPVLRAHDPGAFNVFCYQAGEREDDVTRRLRGLSENWRNIARLDDLEAVHRVLADGIDILVDLAGHTGGGRLLVLARKPAPVQVTWLGYPDTTGLAAIDYRLTDALADPPGQTESWHVESLLRLGRGFLCYAPPEDSPPCVERRGEEHGSIRFGCFNNLPKVSPQMLELWSILLGSVPGARIVLKAYGLAAESSRRALLARFASHGVAPDRVELRAPQDSHARHLAAYQDIDVALDVFPYNGTTTTCEALWMGVPVVTLAGRTHLSRTGASLLTSAGLPELIALNTEQYVDIARRLAADAERRRSLRTTLRERLLASPLLDAAGFTRELEAAYGSIWDARLRSVQ